jgi:hypothetical protein
VQLLGPAKGKHNGKYFELWACKERQTRPWERQNQRQRYDRYTAYKAMLNDVGEYTFRQLRGDPGFGRDLDYEQPTWPPNFFRNQYISLAYCLSNTWDTRITGNKGRSDANQIKPLAVRIETSDRNGRLKLEDGLQEQPDLKQQGRITRCVIFGWDTSTAQSHGRTPEQVNSITVQDLQRSKYYLPITSGFASKHNEGQRLGFGPYDRIWRDDREYRDERRQWTYGGEDEDAVYVRASRARGCATVYMKSGSDARTYQPNRLCTITFTRPEVLELINVSPNPISLKNWTLTFNTGTIANDIGRIRSCHGYSPAGGSTMSNPMIPGNGYFYLVNDMRLFNCEFGSGTPREWGRDASQQIPVWEIPRESWGVQYKITGVTSGRNDSEKYEWIRVSTKNERFDKDQFVGEVMELYDSDGAEDDKAPPHGLRLGVAANGPNWFEFRGKQMDHLRWTCDQQNGGSCDTMMLVGMPAKGGVVSMTLKDEYKQITSRTVEYAYLDQDPIDWYGRSVEKIDPTHYNWRVVRRPSISGRSRRARNTSMRGSEALEVVIKNGAYNSVAEVQRVRSSRDFENIGLGRGSGEGKRTMSALAGVFANSHIRLEAGDLECERTGWQTALGRVQSSGPSSVSGAGVRWESDQWKGHTLRFLTGTLRGESFPVAGNTRVSLDLRDEDAAGRETVPYSTPSGMALTPSRGDVFCIGPGYASPLCYTRRSNDEGTWKWRGRIPVPDEYDLYIFGLNDAINTTEFLEENHNSSIDVYVWNFADESYDKLCERQQYGKEDCFFAGRVKPQHVSANGDLKLRLVSHDLAEDDQDDTPGIKAVSRERTGFAWFNYAVLAPVPVFGRVNVNTASERVLRSLPGIDQRLAHNIALGLDSQGQPSLKPYRQLGDLLQVKDMTLAAFERFVNLVMLESFAYTVSIEAESFSDAAANAKVVDEHDVSSHQTMRYIIELVEADDGNVNTRILEQTRL